jgi:hypothetical protein
MSTTAQLEGVSAGIVRMLADSQCLLVLNRSKMILSSSSSKRRKSFVMAQYNGFDGSR